MSHNSDHELKKLPVADLRETPADDAQAIDAYVEAYRAQAREAAEEYMSWRKLSGFGDVGAFYHALEGAFIRDRLNNLYSQYKTALDEHTETSDQRKKG